MIIGADAASDKTILDTSANLYGSYRLKRVYYSAFSPIPDASRALPLVSPPLIREHRLYQADWLMRFYGFDAGEIVDETKGMLPLDIDPKLAWALRHRDRFPLDVATASREDLLRVPGFGTKAVDRIIATRRLTSIRLATWRGCTSRRRRRCRSSCSAITGRRRICSMARGWRSGSSRRRRNWDLDFKPTASLRGAKRRSNPCFPEQRHGLLRRFAPRNDEE